MIHGRRHSRDVSEKKGAKWLTTFNDMVTLLMVFFVLLFTMSTIDIQKLFDVKTSFLSGTSGLGIREAGKKTDVDIRPTAEKNFIAETIQNLDTEPGVESTRTKEGYRITLGESILFHSGSADISQEGFPVLDKIITNAAKQLKGPIRIEGHTDNVPIKYNRKYPSNWELSVARAVNVVKYFIDTGGISPERLSAVGYGEVKPLFPNDTPENRAKNRRVEIVLINREGV